MAKLMLYVTPNVKDNICGGGGGGGLGLISRSEKWFTAPSKLWTPQIHHKKDSSGFRKVENPDKITMAVFKKWCHGVMVGMSFTLTWRKGNLISTVV